VSASIDKSSEQQRRIRRNVVWLALLALAFYAGFIALSISKAHG